MITNVNGFNYNTAFVKPKPKTQVQFGNAGTKMAKSLAKTAKTNKAVSTVVERAKETAGSFIHTKSGRTGLPKANDDYYCADRVMTDTIEIPRPPFAGESLKPPHTKTVVYTKQECNFPTYTIPAPPTSVSPTSVPTSTSASSGASSNLAPQLALVRCLMPRSILNSLKKFFTGN